MCFWNRTILIWLFIMWYFIEKKKKAKYIYVHNYYSSWRYKLLSLRLWQKGSRIFFRCDSCWFYRQGLFFFFCSATTTCIHIENTTHTLFVYQVQFTHVSLSYKWIWLRKKVACASFFFSIIFFWKDYITFYFLEYRNILIHNNKNNYLWI